MIGDCQGGCSTDNDMDETVLDQKKTWMLREVSEIARAEHVQSWEMIAEGRYMPRRTRGSFPGRELG